MFFLFLRKSGEDGFSRSLGGSKSAEEAILGGNTLNSVGGIEVLDDDELEAGGRALASGNGGPCQEELPDTVPALSVLCVNRLGVTDPVAVPAPDGTAVVDTDGIDATQWR